MRLPITARRVILWASSCLGALIAACSLGDLAYLRDPSCAPNCGRDATTDGAADDANDASDTAPTSGCTDDAGYRALVLCDRPLAYFRLGENGGPTAYDEVDGGPLGSYGTRADGSVSWVDGAIVGDPDPAVRFDENARVTAGAAFPFAGNVPFSIEAWVRPEVVDFGYRRIVERITFDGVGIIEGYLIVNQVNDGLSAARFHSRESTAAKGAPLSTTDYSHVVATFDGATLALYVNGAPDGAVEAGAPLDEVDSVLIIGDGQGGGGGFLGAIDEVAIYGHALSPAQIATHYRVGRGK